MWEDFFLFVFYIFTNGGKKVVVFPSKQRPGRLQNIISSRGQSLPSHYKERPNSKVEGARLSVGDQQKQACARSHHSNITTRRSDPTLLSIDVPPLMHRTRKDRIKYFWGLAALIQWEGLVNTHHGPCLLMGNHTMRCVLPKNLKPLSDPASIVCYQFSAIFISMLSQITYCGNLYKTLSDPFSSKNKFL